jgi:Bacteriocin-protection, YdeI or OmpD-Associated/Domain of unknown function (DUF1905)
VKHTFTAVIKDGAIEVPFDVKTTFGEARAPVQMTFCGETHQNRVAVYGGKYILGIWKAVLEKHDLRDGASLEVTLEHDTAPRTIEPPKELAAALAKNAKAKAGWDAMSYTHQREWANAIADAKKPETKTKRIEQAIEAMLAKTKSATKPKQNNAKKTKPAKKQPKKKK